MIVKPVKGSDKYKGRDKDNKKIYGEFIQTFTFGTNDSNNNNANNDKMNLQQPIVQPGRDFNFPIPTVRPSGIRYISKESKTGILVKKGVYLVSWKLNLPDGSEATVLVNGRKPRIVDRASLDNKLISKFDADNKVSDNKVSDNKNEKDNDSKGEKKNDVKDDKNTIKDNNVSTKDDKNNTKDNKNNTKDIEKKDDAKDNKVDDKKNDIKSDKKKKGYPYTEIISDGMSTNNSFLIEAPKVINLISITNTGNNLIIPRPIAGSKIKTTSVITYIRVEHFSDILSCA